MGDGFWVGSEQTEYSELVRSLISGIAVPTETDYPPIPFETADTADTFDNTNITWGTGIRDVATDLGAKFTVNVGGGIKSQFAAKRSYKPMKFGIMRAALEAYNNVMVTGSGSLGGPKYIKGPFWSAAEKLSDWDNVLGRFLPSSVGTAIVSKTNDNVINNTGDGDKNNPITMKSLFGNPESGKPGESSKSWLAQGLSQLVDSSLIISAYDSSTPDSADNVISRYTLLGDVLQQLYGGDNADAPATSYDVPETGYIVPDEYEAPAAYTVGDAYIPGQLTDLFSEWTIQGPTVWGNIAVEAPLAELTSGIEDDFTIAATLAKQTITALTEFLTTDPSISAPAIVEVEDNIDDAVDAYTAAANLRYAEEEGRIKASLYGARAHMSTYMENTLQLLAAKKQAEIAEFEANLRTEQTRQKMQAGLEYQKQTLDQNTQLAGLKLDGEKADLQAHVAWIGTDVQAGIENQRNILSKDVQERTLLIEAQKAVESNLINLYDMELRRLIAKNEVLLKGDTIKADAFMRITSANAERDTAAEVAKWQEDLQANIVKWGADEKAAIAHWQEEVQSAIAYWQETLRANAAGMEAGLKLFDSKVDVLESIYRAVVGTITLKAQNLGNASAVSGLLQNVIDNNMKATDSYRNYLLNFEKTKYDIATRASGAIANVAELQWKSQLQNMMVIKEAMSAIGATAQGVEHHPSGFEKAGQLVSGVGALASTIMTIGNLF